MSPEKRARCCFGHGSGRERSAWIRTVSHACDGLAGQQMHHVAKRLSTPQHAFVCDGITAARILIAELFSNRENLN
jgi:hypothetical protein